MGLGLRDALFPSFSLCHNMSSSYVIYFQSLIRKDREDLNDPEVPQFFRELVTAYVDPALSPLKLSDSSGHRAPPSLSDISDDDVTPLLSQSV